MKSLIAWTGRMFSGLRFRLLLLVILACAPLVVLILHTAGQDRRRAVTTFGRQADKVAQISAAEERESRAATRQFLLATSESAAIQSRQPLRCAEYVKTIIRDYGRYSDLGVLTTNGEVLASVRPAPARLNRANVQLARMVCQRRAFAVAHFAGGNGKSTSRLTYGYPVLASNNQILAVVFADFNPAWMERHSELPAQLPKGATWTKIDQHGTILERYPGSDAWLGRRLPEQSLLATIFSRSNGVSELQEAGAAMFCAFEPLRLAQERGVLTIPRSVLFAEADRALQRNLTWLGIAAAIALVLGWLGGDLMVVRPVKALIRSSRRLATGDLSARTGLMPAHDELGQLTLAFDQMAQALQEREHERQRDNQKLQLLSQRLVEIQESERRHIARELHDEIGQSLTVAEMNLQAALKLPSTTALERRLEESIEAVERVLEQVHDLSLNLRPSMLDDLGLEPALRWYTNRQAALTGMAAEFRAQPLKERLDPMIETECFRVAQEALTNVVRHAKARAVQVNLTLRNGHLHLSVQDDGVGFDVSAQHDDAVRGASLGLLSMEERASLVGGGLEFRSSPGCGTEVHAWFPLKWQNDLKLAANDE
jgi:signal transduction histidine kinase